MWAGPPGGGAAAAPGAALGGVPAAHAGAGAPGRRRGAQPPAPHPAGPSGGVGVGRAWRLPSLAGREVEAGRPGSAALLVVVSPFHVRPTLFVSMLYSAGKLLPLHHLHGKFSPSFPAVPSLCTALNGRARGV